MLLNPSFEGGWETIPVIKNQIPKNWVLNWNVEGSALLAPKAGNGDTETKVKCIPECVHKLSEQLPADEQLGGKDALILDGSTTYKLFGKSSFRVTLAQKFNVAKGSSCKLVIPVQPHGHLNDQGVPMNIDTGAAYWRFIVNGESSKWFTYNNDFQDRKWFKPEKLFTTADGVVDIVIEFECHTIAGCDFFTDDIKFSIEDTPEPPPPNTECKGLPRVDYERTVHLMPKNPTKVQREKVTEAAYPNRETILYSADDAGIGDLSKKTVKIWWFSPTSWTSKAAMDSFFAQYYPGTIVMHIFDYEVEPPSGFVPHNYVPTGCKTFFHGTADDGITDIQKHLKDRGARMVTAKAVASYGWLDIIHSVDPTCDTIVRPIQWKGANMEWFDPNKDPYVQAENRMNALYDFFQIYKRYTKFFEIMNEQDPPGEEGQASLARFFIRAMEMANDWDIHLAIFSHSTGVPEPAEWDAIAETGIFEKCAAGGHAISLHGYGFMPKDATYHLFRHRDLYNRIILPRKLNIPCFITEYNTVPFENAVWNNLTDAEIINQLAAFDAELAKDPYVAGAHIFTLGSGWDWCRNRWSAIRRQYEDYVVSVKDRVNSPNVPNVTIKTLIGINDPENMGAGGWLADKGESLLVIPVFIGGTSRKLDFTALEAKGIKVIVNLRYSWSTDMGGGGTLPAPITIEWEKFINAAAETINISLGVYAWEIGNEYNNPREWPRNRVLFPEDVALLYNKIKFKVGNVKMCPGAVDPFNAIAGDPRDWVRKIYNTITGAGMTTFHGYTRGAQPENVDSTAKFTDAPLEYQYLNYSGCVETLREVLPEAYKILPVYITEFNHLVKYNGTYGWENDENAMVTINKAYATAKTNGYSGIAMYRWQGDDWTIKDKGNLLYAIENIIKS